MSWIVRNLILDRWIINSRLHETVYDPYMKLPLISEEADVDDAYLLYTDNDDKVGDDIVYTFMNIEDDEYTLLKQVEEKIEELVNSGQISELELKVIQKVSDGNSYKEVAEILNISRISVRKIFSTSCNKIAFALGGVFTNEGYAEYIADKHGLSDQKIEEMMELLESNRRL